MVEHRSAESEGLRFESSGGDSEFFLCSMLVTRQRTSFFISLPSWKLTISLISIYKNHFSWWSFFLFLWPSCVIQGDIVRRNKVLVTLRGPRVYMSTHFLLHVRSPSPEPIYNTEGKRLNTREFRVRKKLEEERHVLIQEALSLNEDYKPPADYK